ncbi:MAG: carboxypeptidase-like regulatory domain-containing protein, partial [Methanomicrobiales archaeon]|nr:carboxypeptidase-like regulatory domain-containing protein [Methanomicrobiales archaeon]
MQRSRYAPLILILAMVACSTPAAAFVVSVYEEGTGNVTLIPDAMVFVSNAIAGKTGADGTLTLTIPGTERFDLLVKKAGYEDWTGSFGVEEGSALIQLSRKHVNLVVSLYDADTLRPIPGGSALATGENATVDSKTNENGTAILGLQASGTYRLDLSAPRYRPQTVTVELAMIGKDMQYFLLRDDRFSVLVKDSSGTPVPGASVYIEGNLRGTTDANGAITLTLDRNKVYNLKVTKEGFRDFNGQQLVGENEALTTITLGNELLRALLTVKDESGANVTGTPVTLNGQAAGITDQNGEILLENLNAGEEYSVSADSPGHMTQTKTFMPTKTGEGILMVLPNEQVAFSIFAEDQEHRVLPGAEILVNGSPAGLTD